MLLLARGADKLYLKHILKHQGDPTTVFIVYIALWFADLCHALAHYALLAGAGAAGAAGAAGRAAALTTENENPGAAPPPIEW